MKIVDILSEDLVVPQMKARNKSSAIDELVQKIASVHSNVDPELARDVLLERERLGSTGVGQGLAIPHGKLPDLDRVIACFSRSVVGIQFDAIDGNQVHLFFTLLAPKSAAGLHLKALARASRLFKSQSFRAELLEAKTSSEIYRLIQSQDEQLSLIAGSHG